MLRFEVKTISPISISDIFFNSTISHISFWVHLKIPSTSSGAIFTLSLKFTFKPPKSGPKGSWNRKHKI